MKKFFFTFLILLLTATSHKPKETYKNTIFYVADPNGIFLFPNPKDIRNRITAPYKTGLVSLGSEKFSIPTKNNEEEEKYFEKFLYKQKIYYVEEDNSNKFIKLEPPNSDLYTYTQVSNATIYSLPFKDSKIVKKLPEFSMLEIVSVTEEFDNDYFEPITAKEIWLKVDFDSKYTGFVLIQEVLIPNSLDKIKLALKNKVKNVSGFFHITKDQSLLYTYSKFEDESQNIQQKFQTQLPMGGKYIPVSRLMEKEGIRYYLLMDLNDSLWIADNQGKLISNREYSMLRFNKSKYYKDMNLFKLFEQKFQRGVDFEGMYVYKFFSRKYKSEFYLINFKYYSDFFQHHLVVERKGNQFKDILFELNSLGAEEGKALTGIAGDMDGDGYPEFIGSTSSRAGIRVSELRSFQNGKLKHIISFSDKCIPEFNKEFITCFEEKYIKNEDGTYKTEKKLLARYKFLKGKLYKEAAKDKWEEVKSESGD